MNSDTFIDHPYLAVVIAIVISLVGALAIFALPVAQYPNVTPPQVSITTTYPGASAQELLDSVIEPIETQVNGVRDLIYLSSTGSNSGSVSITATFRIGSDGRANTQDTQDRVNWALAAAARNRAARGRDRAGTVRQYLNGDDPLLAEPQL